jgi:competence protein ComEA
VDRSAPPWRVLETPAASDPPGSGAGTDPADDGVAGIPVPWLVAGAVAIMIALGLVGTILASGGSPIVDLPGGVGLASGDPGSSAAADAASGAELVVEVAGAVAHPGLYRLAAGQRVADAIAAAGGYGPRVDPARATAELNLASRLSDGDRVVVPSRDDPSQPPTGAGGAAGTGQSGTGSRASGAKTPVDLNRATAAELDALPGIGPVTAAKIIAAREEQRFASVDDLRTRKLVGPSTFEKLRDLVTVR